MDMNFYKSDTNVITDKIWEEYERTKDIALRNQILVSYLYIVTCNIKKMNALSICREDYEDMTNQGVLELINCIERYDYTRGIQFDTFASIRVRGSIIDYIRKKDWVPRDVRRKVKDLNDTANELQSELGRPPSDAELAEKLGVTEEEIHKIRQDELNLNVMGFEELLSENNARLINTRNTSSNEQPEEMLLQEEFRQVLAKCIDKLDKNERTVISLYYFEELKLKEIAFVMDLTPSRISQIHAKALEKLRKYMSEYMDTKNN